MIIAIDGPSGTGKSTIARAVAKRLGFTFFDTGAMYRAFAWYALQEKVDPENLEEVVKLVPRFAFEIRVDFKGERRYLVGSSDVTDAIREPQISSAASQVAVYSEVRSAMVQIQRNFGTRCNAVFEGRDMGTVVFPQADLKIFLTARLDIRAKRRFDELQLKFPDIADTLQFEQIQREIEQRDTNDSTRLVSPLKQAEDAERIDTSDLSVEEVIDKILTLASLKKRYAPMKLAYKIVYWAARLFFKFCFRLKIYGLDHFRPGAGILAANHASNYDPPVLSISCPEEVHFLGKESLFTIPLLGKLIQVLNTHPVSRSASDASTFRLLIQLLQDGNKVILFPEGSRTETGELQPLERGLSFIVQKARCPVFPAYISGTYAAWPRGRGIPKLFGKISVVFGTPIEWTDFEKLEKREAEKQLTQRVELSLKALKGWFDDGAFGTPP